MPEDELSAVVGRLYIALLLRDKEIQRLKSTVSALEDALNDPDPVVENADA